MKLEHSASNQGQSEAVGRKPPLWSREKIAQLIELYKKHECLWNHWHESYKCKEKRNRAIEEICLTLRITKFDFGRKIHNLRNQFNTEMKKLEQRVGEAGESVDENAARTAFRCKWNHFESLMFLRNVIEPRPAGYQSAYQAPKKMRLRFDYNSSEDDVNVTMLPSNTNSSSATAFHSEEISSYQQCEDNDEVTPEEYQNYEHEITEVVQPTAREEPYDQKYQPPVTPQQQQPHTPMTTTLNTTISTNPRTYSIHATGNPSHKTSQRAHVSNSSCSSSSSAAHTEVINLSNEDASVIELNSNNLTVITPTTPASSAVVHSRAPTISSGSYSTSLVAATATNNTVNKQQPAIAMPAAVRDQWDAFGELVACEFRNLNSDISRKRLKRKIMQAMLEVGEQDDAL